MELARQSASRTPAALGTRLTVIVVHELFVERTPHPLGDPAMDLPLDDEGIDHTAGVAHDGVVEDLDSSGLALDLDGGDVDAAGKGRPRRRKVVRRLEPGVHPVGQGRARRAGPRQLGEREAAIRRADDTHDAVGELEVGVADLSRWAASRLALVATARAAISAAFPATTALRLAYVPTPNGINAVSPCLTTTSCGCTPSSSATTCASIVAVPRPRGDAPVTRRNPSPRSTR